MSNSITIDTGSATDMTHCSASCGGRCLPGKHPPSAYAASSSSRR
jgi:hypothetical protein